MGSRENPAATKPHRDKNPLLAENYVERCNLVLSFPSISFTFLFLQTSRCFDLALIVASENYTGGVSTSAIVQRLHSWPR